MIDGFTDPGLVYLHRLKNDFPFFCQELWVDRGYDKFAPLGDIELDICLWIATGPRRRGVLAFRGIGKTHFGTAAYTVWRLLRDPETKILIVSKSAGAAKDTISLIREWIRTVWFLLHLDPGANEYATDAAFQFDVGCCAASRTPSVAAKGIDGQITGSRAEVLIGDDVETPENTMTPDARERLDFKVREFDAIASYGTRDIIYFGTPHHEQSLYPKLASRGYVFRTWSLLYPTPNEISNQLNTAPFIIDQLDSGAAIPGQITTPLRMTSEMVAEKQQEGQLHFLKQYQLLTNLAASHAHPLRLNDLIVMDVPNEQAPLSVQWGTMDHTGSTAITDIEVLGFDGDRLYKPARLDREWARYTGTKAGLDPAGVGDDRTGLAIVSSLAGYLWAHRVLGLTGGASTEALDLIARTLREFNTRDLYVEGNIDTFGTYQQLLGAALRRHFVKLGEDSRFPGGWACSLNMHRASVQKELRIIGTLEPVVSSHRLIVDRSVVMREETDIRYEFQYMFARITKQRKCLREDGRLDALEIAVRAWQNALAQEPEKAADRIRDAKMAAIIREHQDASGDLPANSTNRYFTHR